MSQKPIEVKAALPNSMRKSAIPTSKDVAKRAGVSQSTVCRVYDKQWDGKVKEATRMKVLNAAAALGYNPNALARSLTAQTTGIIGVVVSKTFNEFYYDILCRLTNELQAHGMRVMVYNAEPYGDLYDVLCKLVEYRVDGVIVTAASVTSKVPKLDFDLKIPMVLLNIYTEQPVFNSVYCENYKGAYQMAEFLTERGCTNFAYVSAQNSRFYDVATRRLGFLDGLERCGIDNCQIEHGDYTYESGKAAARRLLSMDHRPDTIFCAGARMAFGVMDVARNDFGLNVPEELSVAGYDDFPQVRLDAYQLTCLKQPSAAMVKESVRILLSEISSVPTDAVQVIKLMPEIVVRHSVRNCESLTSVK